MYEGYFMVTAFKGKPTFPMSACDHCCALMFDCTAHRSPQTQRPSPFSAKPVQHVVEKKFHVNAVRWLGRLESWC